MAVLRKCLHCFNDYDGQSGSAFMCSTCVDETSLEKQGNVTGRQLLKALRSIDTYRKEEEAKGQFIDVKV